MRKVSFEEYIENRSKYKHGDIIPMSMSDIDRVSKIVGRSYEADKNDKIIYNFVEIEDKEISEPIKALIIMQTITLFIVVMILAFKG